MKFQKSSENNINDLNSILGGFLNTENLNTELKEFCIKTALDLYMNESEAESILEKGLWNNKLKEAIKDSLSLYFNKVLPKYISSAFNSKILLDFILGVADNGEITGIPFMGEIDIKYISKIIKKSIKKNIKLNNGEEAVDTFLKKIKINLVKLDINDLLISDECTQLYENYKKTYMKNNDMFEEYNKQWLEWLMDLSRYSTKLKVLINNTSTRNELIEYIQYCNKIYIDQLEEEINSLSNVSIQTISTVTDILKLKTKIEKCSLNSQNLVTVLKKGEYINIPEYEELQIRKIDKEDIMYWLVNFKDKKTLEICNKKPIKPNKLRTYSPLQIISKISLMRKLFIKNSDINYYIIKITIDGQNNEDTVYYNYNGNWTKKKRKITISGEPYSE